MMKISSNLAQVGGSIWRALAETITHSHRLWLGAIGVVLGWLGVYKGLEALVDTEYLGLKNGFVDRNKFLLSLGIYFVALSILAFIILLRALARAYAKVDAYEPLLNPDGSVSAPKYSTELDAKRFGLKQIFDIAECEITSEGIGRTTRYRKILGLRRQIEQIEIQTHSLSSPDDLQGSIRLQLKPSKNRSTRIEPVELLRTKNKCVWTLNFVPSLKENEELEVSYEIESRVGTFAMTEEEMFKRNMPFEYRSVLIQYPTEEFTARTIFPPDFIPTKLTYDVWLGEGRSRHFEEYERMRDGWTDSMRGNQLIGELTVSYPIRGLRYIIYWIPPKKQN